jgi:PIN domain nuclease of toxin-antitoxin system
MPIKPEHALRTVRLPYHHTDPYDRLLIAQAKIEGLTVLTDNPLFAKYDIAVINA